MPTFDVVSQVDLQEVDNAVNNAKKVIETRYDFRGSNTELTLDKKAKAIRISTEDSMKLKAVEEMLAGALVKRGISPKAVSYGTEEGTSKGGVKKEAKLIEGIEREVAKTIVKLIKDTKLKVQAQIQDDQVRVTGKKIDDLQEVIGVLKNAQLDTPLQYINMKS